MPRWSHPPEAVLDDLDVQPEEGLSKQAVKKRRQEYGKNRLRETQTRSWYEILLEQFESVLVLLLLGAAGISFVFGEVVEGIAVLAVIALNAIIGFVTEMRAVRSMESLQELTEVDAKVRRNGSIIEIPAKELVPGDIVILDSGNIVTADVRLIEANKLQVDEAPLTGESVPVDKQIEPVDEETPLAERTSMAYKGTAITRGSGEGVVVATGMETELGTISSLVEQAEGEETPLEERLDSLGHRLVWLMLGMAALVVVSGLIVGRELYLVIETAIALAVATVPEGLPLVATVGLARGMWRMAERNALIERLSAVETLGSTTIICTDKTGTLTENLMTVTQVTLPDDHVEVTGRGLEMEGEFQRDDETVEPSAPLCDLLEAGVLCNNASLNRGSNDDPIGEPLEVALLIAGAKADLYRPDLLDEKPEEREIAFDPDTKMMATFHQKNGSYQVAIKGAPEAVIDACTQIRTPDGTSNFTSKDEWHERNEQMASDGLRVLGLAMKQADSTDADPYADLTFLGLTGLLDPPREDVRDSIAACREAGIQVVMVTGDHPATARRVGIGVNLIEEGEADVVLGEELIDPDEMSEEKRHELRRASITARVTPEQKLNLIALHQNANEIVAMTGDGVNDAPALEKADIGVAMGQRGTQVAKDAADMVLQDDSFSTIITAIEQGRVIFENIRKFVLYLLSCNISEIFIVGLASLFAVPLPLNALQILYLNVVTDVFPALALGVGEGDPAIMERPPRDPQEPIMTRSHWTVLFSYGALLTAAVLGTFALALFVFEMPDEQATTVSFLTLAFAQTLHVFNMRDKGSNVFKNDVTTNHYVWGALVLTTGLLMVTVYVPFMADLLGTTPPGQTGWMLVAGGSTIPLIIGQIIKEVQARI